MNMNTLASTPALPAQKALRTAARLLCGGLALGLALSAPPVVAGNFGVSPISLNLDRNARSGSITVSNDDVGLLRVQIRLFEWTQDATGKDDYRESEDLIYFPKLMAMEKSQQKLVRVGLRIPAGAQEKTYRLFVEQLPAPPVPGAPPGARVVMKVRFGVPIFVKPAKPDVRGEIGKIEMTKGTLRVTVRNTGNVHFVVSALAVTGGGAYAKEIAGWYVLAGKTHEYAIPVAPEMCTKLGRVDVTAKTEQFELKGALDVAASMCAP